MMRRLLGYWYPLLSLVGFAYLYVAHRDASVMHPDTYHVLWNLNCFVFIFSIFASPPLRKRRIPRKVQRRIDAENERIATEHADAARKAAKQRAERKSLDRMLARNAMSAPAPAPDIQTLNLLLANSRDDDDPVSAPPDDALGDRNDTSHATPDPAPTPHHHDSGASHAHHDSGSHVHDSGSHFH